MLNNTMKNIRTLSLFFAFCFSAFAPSFVFAGDYAQLNFIGFSADGKFLAFEEFGSHDGSGYPYSNIYFVDVAKNSYAAAPIRQEVDDKNIDDDAIPEEKVIRAKAKKAAAPILKRLKIVAGNTGNLVVARLLTDFGANKSSSGDEKKNQTIEFTDEVVTNVYLNIFELSLKTSEVKIKECDYNSEPVLKFELSLSDRNLESTKILQKDLTLPRSRNCPYTYSIQNVYLYGDKIAVFINVYSVGFEGPDMRYMVVSGKYE
jgi:predicted secreted protein